MNVENFLDAIEVIVNKRVEENNTQIYTGIIVKEGTSLKVKVIHWCSLKLNGKHYLNWQSAF